MSRALLGDTLDIHGGGLDLQFPHHENELAQSESCNDTEFAKVWMHNGLLSLRDKDGKYAKMAGSIGNVLNVADALRHMGGPALRFFILGTHYRSPIDLGVWDWNNPDTPLPENMVAARKAFETFTRFAERAERITGRAFATIANPYGKSADENSTVSMKYVSVLRRFDAFLDDDFNTGGAVGLLFELVTTLNKLADAAKLEDPMATDAAARGEFLEGAGLVRAMTDILGLDLSPPKAELAGGNELVGGLMQLLLDLRAKLRDTAKTAEKTNPLKAELFAQTDLIRTRLAALGVTLEDRPGGTTWRVG
jgi:cysteinyl-tRNA synthetase